MPQVNNGFKIVKKTAEGELLIQDCTPSGKVQDNKEACGCGGEYKITGKAIASHEKSKRHREWRQWVDQQ